MRQDGVLVNSDLYDYPASHYSPALEGVERVTLVRGTAALQYGSQFGGVIDYVTRAPDTTRAAAFESRSGVGVGNALDVRYFTKRPTFYPGPGVWPSDGRALRLTVDRTR